MNSFSSTSYLLATLFGGNLTLNQLNNDYSIVSQQTINLLTFLQTDPNVIWSEDNYIVNIQVSN